MILMMRCFEPTTDHSKLHSTLGSRREWARRKSETIQPDFRPYLSDPNRRPKQSDRKSSTESDARPSDIQPIPRIRVRRRSGTVRRTLVWSTDPSDCIGIRTFVPTNIIPAFCRIIAQWCTRTAPELGNQNCTDIG